MKAEHVSLLHSGLTHYQIRRDREFGKPGQGLTTEANVTVTLEYIKVVDGLWARHGGGGFQGPARIPA